MKTILLFALFWTTFDLIVVQAASDSTVLPQCGLNCIAGLVAESPCALTNTTCICTNQQLSDSISSCVSSNCTIRDQLSTEKYSREACGAPIINRGRFAYISCLVVSAIAYLAFFLRIGARLVGDGHKLGLDDLCLTGTILLNVPFTATSIILNESGFGQDIWEVPFDSITYILYVYFWGELIYLTALPLIKISILFFYLRIFPDKRFRQITWTLIVCNFAYIIAYLPITIFQCRPIEGAWKRWDGTFQGKCNDTNLQIWTSAGFNIGLDVAVLFLPLPSLYKLNLSPKKKFQILLMFGVGFFVTLVSIIRLQSLVRWAYSTNITQDYVSVGAWSIVEIDGGVICACMPAIRGLLQRVFSTPLGSTVVGSIANPNSSASNARRPPSFSHHSHKSSNQNDSSSVHELIGVAD